MSLQILTAIGEERVCRTSEISIKNLGLRDFVGALSLWFRDICRGLWTKLTGTRQILWTVIGVTTRGENRL